MTNILHKFWYIHVSQDISMEYMPKCTIRKGAKRIWAKRTQGNPSRSKTGPSTSMTGAQVHPRTHLPTRVRAHPGCSHTQVEPPCDHHPLVGYYVGLDISCVGVLPRCVGCLGFWHDSPYVQALICLATGPLFFGLSQMVFVLCLLAHF